jgi:hypothetical protein
MRVSLALLLLAAGAVAVQAGNGELPSMACPNT